MTFKATMASAQVPAGLAGRLIASDIRYFELGARIERVAGARLAWMPGLADMPAGCVVLGADRWAARTDATAALDAVEERVATVGGRQVRLYLETDDLALAKTLQGRGYRSRDETGLLLLRRAPGADRVSLRTVGDAAGWALKRALHVESPDFPDGHDTTPERWVELERRKSQTGGLTPWLIRVGDVVAGTACTMEQEDLLRLKNIVIHRALRRRGIASAAVAAFGMMGERSGRTLGFFGVPGSPGERVYLRCGMVPVVRWVEWLGPSIPKQGRCEVTG
ncbi:MAG TPA: GNAT family N-acetyltransferase [Gemmatimonadota bacterium]|nr:GNAT family N-acetyltransferase [Gemmatimonadota bacterium]